MDLHVLVLVAYQLAAIISVPQLPHCTLLAWPFCHTIACFFNCAFCFSGVTMVIVSSSLSRKVSIYNLRHFEALKLPHFPTNFQRLSPGVYTQGSIPRGLYPRVYSQGSIPKGPLIIGHSYSNSYGEKPTLEVGISL